MDSRPNPPLPPAQLTPGTHLSPEDGACLMEWVSALAGEPWTDHPTTTHRLLAHLGRLVNDAMSPNARQGLIALGPRLSGLDSQRPAMTAEVAELTTAYALSVRPGLRLAWMHGAADRHRRWVTRQRGLAGRGGVVSRVRRRIYDHGPAHRAVETAVMALARTADADLHLRRLLEEAVTHLEACSAAEADTWHAPSPQQRQVSPEGAP